MLIALPNSDGSFTSTLFAPAAMLRDLDRRAESSEEKTEVYLRWFREHYADAVALLGDDQLRQAFTSYPRGPLITIQVRFALSSSLTGSARRTTTSIAAYCSVTRPTRWCRALLSARLR